MSQILGLFSDRLLYMASLFGEYKQSAYMGVLMTCTVCNYGLTTLMHDRQYLWLITGFATTIIDKRAMLPFTLLILMELKYDKASPRNYLICLIWAIFQIFLLRISYLT